VPSATLPDVIRELDFDAGAAFSPDDEPSSSAAQPSRRTESGMTSDVACAGGTSRPFIPMLTSDPTIAGRSVHVTL